MTRRLFQLLIVMLALQFSWSVVSAYCTHESGRAAEHFGHHQHKPDGQHQLAGAGADQPQSLKKSGGTHSHCSSCSHAVSALAAVGEPVWRAGLSGIRPVGQASSFSSRVLAPPERPQWRMLS